jgi:hypothetical protein
MTIQIDNVNTSISAVGSDTNIPVNIQTKGTGGLNLLGSGQNLVTQSQTFSTWSLSSGTLTTNQTTDPLGGNTASKFVPTNGQTSCWVQLVGIPASIATYTLSCYLKTAGLTSVRVNLFNTADGDRFSVYDISAGTITSTSANATSTITSVGNGWYRCSVTYTITGLTTTQVQVARMPTGTGDGTNGYFLWGAQLELASSVGVYVPTTTAAIYGTPTLTFSGVAGLGLQSDGSLYVQPAGTGALQAQATTSTTAGGNARGTNAVDLQTSRSSAAAVASGQYSFIGAGNNNSATSTGTISMGLGNGASGFGSATLSGNNNSNSSTYSVIAGGQNNVCSAYLGFVGSGLSNTAAGAYNFIGGGSVNSGTANAAVTTQSGTMNGTTAVTLSGSNASIRVGQYIGGTSIGADTYVAAISGTSLTLSKVATGSSTSTLSFFTPHGVVVGGGNNQATGSYSFIGGGGDAGNSSLRNTASGDWSVVCGGTRNTASGIASFVGGGGASPPFGTFPNTASNNGSAVVGGFTNTASGLGAFVGGGFLNTANGQYSAIMGGQSGIARGVGGNHVFSACSEPISSVQGVSQAALLVLAVQTTDATPTALRSSAAAAGTTNQVILPSNAAYFFTGEVVSGVTGGGDTKGWTIEGVIKRGAGVGTTALVGTPTVTSLYADAGASTWDIAVTADTTNGGLRVTFTGQAATTIRTVAQIRTTEMTF